MKTPTFRTAQTLAAASALSLLLLLPVAASAQGMGGGSDSEAAQEVLLRTQELLDGIQPLVQESDSEQARRIFQDAVEKQSRAHTMHGQGRYAFAIRVSLQARESARQAERMARDAQGYQERARNQLDRLLDLYEQVKERAQNSGHTQALRFVREAESAYQRAREQYQQTNYQRAFQLLQTAETHLKRAARLLFESGDAERLVQELDRTADLIALASERLDDASDPALVDLLGQARSNLERARQFLADDQPLQAMRLAKRAREQARRVLRQVGDGPAVDGVQDQIDRFDARIAELGPRVVESGDPQARDLLDRAAGLRNQAVQVLEEGRTAVALRQIRTADNLLRQAADRIR
jgi:tetratricopeptide (TPR) repeat protein